MSEVGQPARIAHSIEQWEKLKAEHKPHAFEHEKTAMALEVEGARLVAYGSLGALAVAWTCAFETEKQVCTAYLETGSSLLVLGGILGASAISFMGGAHSNRSRAETVQMMESHRVSTGEASNDADPDTPQKALDDTHRFRNLARLSTLAGTWAALSAFPLMYQAAKQTFEQKCSISAWSDWTAWLSAHWPF